MRSSWSTIVTGISPRFNRRRSTSRLMPSSAAACVLFSSSGIGSPRRAPGCGRGSCGRPRRRPLHVRQPPRRIGLACTLPTKTSPPLRPPQRVPAGDAELGGHCGTLRASQLPQVESRSVHSRTILPFLARSRGLAGSMHLPPRPATSGRYQAHFMHRRSAGLSFSPITPSPCRAALVPRVVPAVSRP